jgi:4-amino-4-deoxy-L-arabinose transferase-like glycosyltransferase
MDSTARLKPILPVLLLVFVFLAVSLAGLDFGVHWDETHAKFDSVKRSVETGVFVQSVMEPEGESYDYGGVNYWLTWLGFTPEVASYVTGGVWTREALARVITPVVYSIDKRLQVRTIYIVLSSLSILWLYWLCLELGRSRIEAWLAAAVLSLSWEVGYHSRWIAPDAVAMQFAILSFLCLVAGQNRSSMRWFCTSAVAVGLTAGTKYPGALILPCLLVAVAFSQWRNNRTLLASLKQVVLTAAVTAATFVATTPGVVLDPFRFFARLEQQRLIYLEGWYGYSVLSGVPHLWAVIQYFAFEVFSHFSWIAAVLGLFALIGVVALAFERKIASFLIVAFCLIYLLLFSRQAAMLVRDYLVVVPFLALAAARGIVAIAERTNARAVYAGVGVLLAVNFVWEVHAAGEIRKRADYEYFVRQFEDFARESEGETFLASAKLMADLRRLPDPIPANVTADPAVAYTKVAFLQAEGADELWSRWPANQKNLYDRAFGALEVNLDRYPTFVGNNRILVVRREELGHFPFNAEYLAAPDFGVSKTTVVAGSDSYRIRVKKLPGANVILRYSYEGGAAEEFPVTLKARGEAQFDVAADARKGAYRFLAYRLASESNWFNVDATVTVK